MATQITVSDPRITSMKIDLDKDRVILHWVVDDERGRQYTSGHFVFVRNKDIEDPDNYIELTTAAKSALTTLIGLGTAFIDSQNLP